MSAFRPRSFLQLVLLGFALVTLPLIIATINATLSVGHLADQSQQAVQDAVQVTQSSRLLVEHLIDTERFRSADPIFERQRQRAQHGGIRR